MRLITKLLLGFFGLISCFVQAQSVFHIDSTPGEISGTVGSTIAVDLIATQFTDIAGFQFALAYDNTKIKIVSVDIPGNSTLTNWNFTPPTGNINIASTNHIKFSWNDPSGSNNTLAPNTVLCTLFFDILAEGSSVICLDPLVQPVARAFGTGNLAAEFVSFNCEEITRTGQLDEVDGFNVKVAPNPITSNAEVYFTTTTSTSVELGIINTLGQNCWQRSMTTQAGENKISIDRTQFPASGLYYITLQHATGRTAYPIWVQ
jgi:Cohesin domain